MNPNPSAIALITVLILIPAYFLPTIVACIRDKVTGKGGIFFLNLLLGWTVIGWWAAFIWACTGGSARQAQAEAQRHNELLTALAAGRGPTPARSAVTP